MTLLAEPPTVVRCRYPGCNRPLHDPDSVASGYGSKHDPNDRHKPHRARARTQQGPDLLDLIPKEPEVPDPAETLAQRLIEGPLADVIAEAGADTGGTVPDIKRRLVADLRATLPEPVGYVVMRAEDLPPDDAAPVSRTVGIYLDGRDAYVQAAWLSTGGKEDMPRWAHGDYRAYALVSVPTVTEGDRNA